MLEQLLDLVKQVGQQTVVENPAVPNEKNNDVLAEATSSIAGGFQNILSGGGLQSLLGLFGGGGNAAAGGSQMSLTNNPIVSMITGHFMNKLMSKFGIQSSAASGIAASLIPTVLGKLIHKTNDSNDSSFDLKGILGGLIGGGGASATSNAAASGGGFDLGGMLSKVLASGGDHNEFQDLLANVTGGAQQAQAQQAQSGTGLFDMIKGLLK
jgi:hypothetical protein